MKQQILKFLEKSLEESKKEFREGDECLEDFYQGKIDMSKQTIDFIKYNFS